jgi:hypothetical protein
VHRGRAAWTRLTGADKWQQTILWEFPENYKLYEHIKTKADGQAKTVKNHSGGGHDRQDAYLYGYPKGPRKRYRSPADFFPHLLWLCTDDNSDYQNCTCKMCSPVQLEVEKPAVKAEIKSERRAPSSASNLRPLLRPHSRRAHRRSEHLQCCSRPLCRSLVKVSS